MRKFIHSIVVLTIVMTSLTACLGDSVEYTYYDDAAITGFSIGTLKRTLTKKNSSEKDSVYYTTVNCSKYSFHIDQQKGEIWNVDSLPVGADISKVICTINTKNSGTVGLQRTTSDTLDIFNSSDSIDFTTPRKFFVYSQSGQGKREYKVNINVHKEVGDTCFWSKMVAENADIAALTDMKAVCLGNALMLFGSNGTETKVYTTDINDGTSWAAVTTDKTLDAGAAKGIVERNSVLYTVSEGKLLYSLDGATWTEQGCDASLCQLVAASTARLYALSTDKKLLSSLDEGATWTEEQLDDNAALLPTESLSYIVKPSKVNAMTDRIVIIGNRSLADYPDDTTAKVWTKVEEYSDGARESAWNYIEFSDVNKNKAPRAKNWQLITYDDNNIKAICGKAEGNAKNVALDRFYHSADDGITWRKDSVLYLPKVVLSSSNTYQERWNEPEKWPNHMFTSDTQFAMTKDSNNMVWIICGGTGQVWKGRVPRVAWKKE